MAAWKKEIPLKPISFRFHRFRANLCRCIYHGAQIASWSQKSSKSARLRIHEQSTVLLLTATYKEHQQTANRKSARKNPLLTSPDITVFSAFRPSYQKITACQFALQSFYGKCRKSWAKLPGLVNDAWCHHTWCGVEPAFCLASDAPWVRGSTSRGLQNTSIWARFGPCLAGQNWVEMWSAPWVLPSSVSIRWRSTILPGHWDLWHWVNRCDGPSPAALPIRTCGHSKWLAGSSHCRRWDTWIPPVSRHPNFLESEEEKASMARTALLVWETGLLVRMAMPAMPVVLLVASDTR